MSGELFPDRVPLRYWPLPEAQSIERYDPKSRLDYWPRRRRHFQQLGWLDRRQPGWRQRHFGLHQTGIEALADEASHILESNRRIRVAVPLEDEQLATRARRHSSADADRVITAGVPLISPTSSLPSTPWYATANTGCERTCRGLSRMPGQGATSAMFAFGRGWRFCDGPIDRLGSRPADGGFPQ